MKTCTYQHQAGQDNRKVHEEVSDRTENGAGDGVHQTKVDNCDGNGHKADEEVADSHGQHEDARGAGLERLDVHEEDEEVAGNAHADQDREENDGWKKFLEQVIVELFEVVCSRKKAFWRRTGDSTIRFRKICVVHDCEDSTNVHSQRYGKC